MQITCRAGRGVRFALEVRAGSGVSAMQPLDSKLACAIKQKVCLLACLQTSAIGGAETVMARHEQAVELSLMVLLLHAGGPRGQL